MKATAELKMLPVSVLKPAAYNPRKKLKPGDKEYEKIKNSITEFGFADPLVVNADMTIIGGHQRLTVAMELGYTEVPCAVVDIDKTREKALNIALNKITGAWDDSLLADLLKDIEDSNFDLGKTGFEPPEIETLFNKVHSKEVKEDDFDVESELKQPCFSKEGDLWHLGKSDMSEYNKVIQIEPQHDQFDDVRMEYAQMLKQQLAKGNNGLVRTKYITFSIEAKSVREAKPRLERIETDILNNFKVLGVKAYPLNGVERLQIMYETFHQEEQQKFDFSYDRILQSGMTTKDFIAPTSFLFKSGKDFMMGDTYGAASYLNILAPELTDKVLAEFLDMDKNLVVSIHVQSVDQLKAIKLIKGKITDLDRMKIEEQKKAVRSGYDMEIIPSDLATYGGEAKKILDDLQSRNERMFLVTVLFLNTAKTKQELDSAVFQTAGIAQKFNCTLNRLDYLQEQGLMSSLPLANNLVPIKRALTTTSTAIFVPFTTQELFMEGDSLYYGLNAVSNNMIMADRKQLKNPNGLILGTPGSGKSFSAKREITNVFFTTTDDIIVADPEGEYYENWRFEDLPILPVEWKLLVHNTKKPQFNVLRKLLRSKKFDYVVNACDAGREGEAIFRRVYALAGSKLPIKRLWISSMEDAAIQQGFENLKDGAAYDINNSKVTDHHAILPTMQGAKCNKEKLSEIKQKILSLVIWKLVQAVQPPFIYEDILVTVYLIYYLTI